MSVTVFCSIFLSLSALLIVAVIIIEMCLHRVELKRNGIAGRRRILAPFQIFAVCFFLATVLILYPIYHFDYLAGDVELVKIIKRWH